jgi:DNA helicase-2/ATP-dependent DNA helicase PcrA
VTINITRVSSNSEDEHVDKEIRDCIDENRSFFLFAGAGSGKTRSLVSALEYIQYVKGDVFSQKGQKVAVITYTNAACDEIMRRLQYNLLFQVSTIHSFLWSLIQNFQEDIREWLKDSLNSEIKNLNEEQNRAKNTSTKTYQNRANKIQSKKDRITKLDTVKKFNYNPNGQNLGIDSLSHEEVIQMGSSFIQNSDTMQEILVSKFPILFIDESQDTKSALIDAIIPDLSENYSERFMIGMFGDVMQRIYLDGKEGLCDLVPSTWVKPEKVLNFRSDNRIVQLANSIRETLDGIQQKSRANSETGIVRLFIADDSCDKDTTEKSIATKMSSITNDEEWSSDNFENLILEHRMAAIRLGFCNLYDPLHDSKQFNQSILDGSIAEISFLYNVINSIVMAESDFERSQILRENTKVFKILASKEEPANYLEQISTCVDKILKLFEDSQDPKCIDFFSVAMQSEVFGEISSRSNEIIDGAETDNEKVNALRSAFQAPFSELVKYYEYISDKTRFGTHQGVKGLEFDRVMVILDDAESKGFLFSYEKLFGAKDLSDTDKKNIAEGKDNSIDRTSRLFYVCCTRAKKSLAIVCYTSDKEAVHKTVMGNGWFAENEIEIL